jgi:hypothetical protein
MIDVSVPRELADHYRLLTSPYEDVTFGWRCGHAGEPTSGSEAVRAIQQAGRRDLLRNIMPGPSPAGRAFAAATLLRSSDPLAAEDRASIEAIRTLPPRVTMCQGCDPHGSTAAAELGRLSVARTKPAPTPSTAAP